MKKALLLLMALSIRLLINAQLVTVPNTATFSLSDVYAAVQFHSTAVSGNLSSCFTNAVTQFFDPTYNQDSYAPANSMLRFRNYGPKNTQTFTTTGSWTNSVSGTVKVVVLIWGAGGSGGCGLATNDYYGGGGGGGGSFIKAFMDVTVGNSYNYRVGARGGAVGPGVNGIAGTTSDFTASTQYIAAYGGQGGLSYANGRTGGNGGGTGISGISSLNNYNGGTGATAPLTGASPYSGGGGGGAGTTGVGNNGSGAAGGASRTIDGGEGGNGSGVANGGGTTGFIYGSGGGGSTRSGSSGAGVAGKIMIYY